MQTRPGICQRKRRYASRAEADAAALQADTPLRTYKCALCHKYHLTSRTKGLRPPRAALTAQD
jgi:predicted CXXCH cytochrome family protein